MSQPRPVTHRTVLVSRRVARQEFRLRPSDLVNQIIGYIVAVLVGRHGVKLHAMGVMSNHWHLVLTVPISVEADALIDFVREAHALIARHIGASFGEFEGLWSKAQTSIVDLVTIDDVIEKIAYVMCNPIEARLVTTVRHWPGQLGRWADTPDTIYQRPRGFFRPIEDGGAWPDEAVLTYASPAEAVVVGPSVPAQVAGADDVAAALAAHVETAVNARAERLVREARAAGKPFLGRQAVLRQRRHARPIQDADHFGLSPRLACRDKWRRIERLARNRQWLADYHAARRVWRAGLPAVFPHGTYKLRVEARVVCQPPPT